MFLFIPVEDSFLTPFSLLLFAIVPNFWPLVNSHLVEWQSEVRARIYQ